MGHRVKRWSSVIVAPIFAMIVLTGFDPNVSADAGESEQIKVKYINHRGYSMAAPENTLPAFRMSKEMGFNYVEADISFTKDNVPVLLHNATINRTARKENGKKIKKKIRISDITFKEAHRYDYGVWKSKEYAGVRIPKLKDFLRLCKSLHLHPYLDIKSNGLYAKQQISAAVKLVEETEMKGEVTWVSFDTQYLKWVSECDSTARLGVLGTAVDDKNVSDIIEKANELKMDGNEVFVDLANGGPGNAPALCREAGVPLEMWICDLQPWLVYDEKEVLKKMDPYISGVTIKQNRFAMNGGNKNEGIYAGQQFQEA